jgi:RND family efflux transporter MFP subunit
MIRSPHRWLLLLTLVALAGSTFSTATGALPGVETTPLDLSRYSGVARASRELVVTAPVDGLLGRLPHEAGAAVRAGDEIAAMDDRVQTAVVEVARLRSKNEAALIAARESVAYHKLEVDRVRELVKQQAANTRELRTAEVQLAQAEAEVMNAEAQLEQAAANLALEQRRLELLHLRAPFDAAVMEVIAETGAALRVGDPILRIAQLDPLEVELPLPASLYNRLRVDERYTLEASIPVGTTLEATLTRRADEIDPASDTFIAVFEIPNPDTALPAGFRVHLANLTPPASN